MTADTADAVTNGGPEPGPASNVPASFRDDLRDLLVSNAGFLYGDEVEGMLNVTSPTLLALAADGHLDLAVVGGEVFVTAESALARARRSEQDMADSIRTARSLARRALGEFLRAVPVTGEWGRATEEHRPLVCRRRGREFATFGIEMHSVVLNPRWISAWVSREGIGRVLELAQLPTGPFLATLLAELPGVTPMRSATALLPDAGSGVEPRAHAPRGWLRLDAKTWPPAQVPESVAAAVRAPEGDA